MAYTYDKTGGQNRVIFQKRGMFVGQLPALPRRQLVHCDRGARRLTGPLRQRPAPPRGSAPWTFSLDLLAATIIGPRTYDKTATQNRGLKPKEGYVLGDDPRADPHQDPMTFGARRSAGGPIPAWTPPRCARGPLASAEGR